MAVPEAERTKGMYVSFESNTENQLIKLGLISPEFENILVEPAKEYTKQTKTKSVDKARVITSEKLKCIPLPVMKEPAELKRRVRTKERHVLLFSLYLLRLLLYRTVKIVNEYDQKIPQSQTADKPVAL